MTGERLEHQGALRAPRQLLVAGAGIAAALAIAVVALVVSASGGSGGGGSVLIEPALSTPTPLPTPRLELRAAAAREAASPTPAHATPTAEPAPATEPALAPAPPAPPTPAEEPTAARPDPPPPPPPAPPATGSLAGLRVYSNGDSTSYFMSVAVLAGAVAQGGVQVQPTPEYHVSSGLASANPFDWYAFLASESALYRPDVVVFMVGANDAYPGMDLAAYRTRVGRMMDQLQGARLIWVGQPNMGRADLATSIPGVNAVFAEEAGTRPWVRYVDTWSLTSDASGAFTPYLPDGTLARADDGVHFTSSGGAYLAQAVLAAIAGG